jgi:hypothetical protein
MDWFAWHRERKPRSSYDLQRVDAALDRITASHPRLRLAPRFKSRLAPAVQKSMDYAHSIAQALPASRLACASTWAEDPLIRAAFASPEDLVNTLSRSHRLRDFFAQHPAALEAHALLGMTLTERTTLGVAQAGDTVRQDVPRTTLCFSDHHAHVCAPDEPTLRLNIEQRVLDELALRGLSLITADQQHRDHLDEERALLKSRLRLLERRGASLFTSQPQNESHAAEQLAHLLAQLQDNERQIIDLGGHVDGLRHDLERIHDVLLDPAGHLELFERQVCLDAMNVLHTQNPPPNVSMLSLTLARFHVNPPLTRSFMLVRVRRHDLRAPLELLEAVARELL